ncbi:MAG: hypothetical protein JWM68_3979 [Verrucomicrobiales bacterium]|nr:hypothetical protein [Verrucomicrobiales bacterium]
MKKSFVFGVVALASALQIVSAADITGKVTLKGTPPPEKEIPMDAVCGKLHTGPVKTRLYVVGADNGLANTFVYIKSGLPAGKKFEPTKPLLLDQVGCLYDPYISGVMVGQEFQIRNSDAVLHNVHTTPAVNPELEFNFGQPVQGQVSKKTLNKPEVMLRFKCDVHPWMFAYVGVVEHPFFAVTDKDGNFTIPNVPPGKYTLEAKHMKAGVKPSEITVGDKNETVAFELSVPQ